MWGYRAFWNHVFTICVFFISGVFIFVQPLETDILIYNNLKRIGFYFSYTKKSDSVGPVAQKCQDP